MIGGRTPVLALVGQPVGHSLNPGMHNASFEADGLGYVCLDDDPDDLAAAVRGMAALKLRGFNVTMPHKQAMVGLVDDLDEGPGSPGRSTPSRSRRAPGCAGTTPTAAGWWRPAGRPGSRCRAGASCFWAPVVPRLPSPSP